MSVLLSLLGLGLVIYFFIVPGIAWLNATDAKKQADDQRTLIADLQAQIRELRDRLDSFRTTQGPWSPPPQPVTAAEKRATPPPQSLPDEEASAVALTAVELEPTAAPPPPALTTALARAAELAALAPAPASASASASPASPALTPASPPLPPGAPPLPLLQPVSVPAAAPSAPVSAASPAPAAMDVLKTPVKALTAPTLEQFLGVKLFAWVGGLALFLGVVFFVKYAFEHNLISEAMRITMGYLFAGALVASGIILRGRKSYTVLTQTLTATGFVTLYGVTYAAYALYDFPAFTTGSTFIYMAVITTAAFVTAVQLYAPVVAVLGMAGGFLTPILVNTGVDNPIGLFGYVLVLDLGLFAVAAKRRWHYLIACAGGGTLLLQAGWFFEWFWKGGYHLGARIWIPVTVHLFFPLLFAAANVWLSRITPLKETAALPEPEEASPPPYAAIGGLVLAGWSFVVSFILLEQAWFIARPATLYAYLFALNAAVLAQIWLHPRTASAQWMAAAVTFIHLASWSSRHLTEGTLVTALVCYLVFGLMHTGFALLAMRMRPETMEAQKHGIWLGPVAVLLVIAPILSLADVSWMVWPTVLILDLMTIAVAALTLSLGPVLLSLVITLVAMTVWLFRLPETAGHWPFLLTLGGFALVFAAAGALLSTRVRRRSGAVSRTGEEWLLSPEGLLPIASAALPFFLLIIATQRLRMVDPSPVFILGTLLSLGFLALMRISKLPALGMAALVCMGALEYSWFLTRYDVETGRPWQALAWFTGIGALFAAFPFVWQKSLRDHALPWIVSACSWLVQYPLVFQVFEHSLPLANPGLIPAAFVLPSALSFMMALKMPHAADPAVRSRQLAWFGGVTLFFVTAFFPVQFDQHWYVGWALEGAALAWLWTRVPHEGLLRVAFGLLAFTFTYLLLRPVVTDNVAATGPRIWNGFLFDYGLCGLSHLAAAACFPLRRNELGLPLRNLLWSLGGILLFLLVNIEITHAFTPAGESFHAFEIGGNFPRDMSTSIAWAVFALALLVIGFWSDVRGPRYAGIGLLGITLLKLFIFDLANIKSIYRVGALMIVAIIALGASYLYQRYYARQSAK